MLVEGLFQATKQMIWKNNLCKLSFILQVALTSFSVHSLPTLPLNHGPNRSFETSLKIILEMTTLCARCTTKSDTFVNKKR